MEILNRSLHRRRRHCRMILVISLNVVGMVAYYTRSLPSSPKVEHNDGPQQRQGGVTAANADASWCPGSFDTSKTDAIRLRKSERYLASAKLPPPYNATHPPRPHPHAGARDEDGKWGYVADPTTVRRRLWESWKLSAEVGNDSDSVPCAYSDDGVPPWRSFLPFATAEEERKVCSTAPKEGAEKEAWDVMTRKIIVGAPDVLPDIDLSNETDVNEWEAEYGLYEDFYETVAYRNGPKPPRIFCGIYTHEGNHHLLQASGETWGWRCDGFLGFSTKTNTTLGAVDLPHMGDEAYDNMWQKVRSIWAYIHDNYFDDYDYFHLSGDDNHFIIENMRNYLWSLNDHDGELHLHIGHRYRKNPHNICGGGSGYTFNKATLRIFVEKVLPHCETSKRTSAEDRFVGLCLGRNGVHCHNTADIRGGQRYIGMEPNFVATFNGDRGFFVTLYKLWAEGSGHWLIKDDILSSQHVAWHLIKLPVSMKRLHAVMYRSCGPDTTLGEALRLHQLAMQHTLGEK